MSQQSKQTSSNQPVQVTNLPVSKPSKETANQATTESLIQVSNHAIRQSTKQITKRSVSQLSKQPSVYLDQPAKHKTKRPLRQSNMKPRDQFSQQSILAYQAINHPTKQVTKRPVS